MDMIFLALITGYLLYRLWMVLGQETEGDQQRRDKKMPYIDGESNVIQMPGKQIEGEASLVEEGLKPGAKIGLDAVKEADPSFDFDYFLKGAKSAYEMIVTAFAQGDKETLQQLLTRKVFGQFEAVIEERTANNRQLDIKIDKFERVDVDSIELIDQQIAIAVRFKTSQVRLMTDEAGTILDNPAKISTSITDIWTFIHVIGSSDPVWHLAATKTETNAY